MFHRNIKPEIILPFLHQLHHQLHSFPSGKPTSHLDHQHLTEGLIVSAHQECVTQKAQY